MTLEQKFMLLANSKDKIKAKILEKGVNMPANTPFNNYDTYIDQIDGIEETTTDQDLMIFSDLIDNVGSANYVYKEYTSAEIQEVNDYADKILTEGDL